LRSESPVSRLKPFSGVVVLSEAVLFSNVTDEVGVVWVK
jgi:hypothetical protein